MDMFAAEAVVELRKEYPEIILEMVSPLMNRPANGLESTSGGKTVYFAQANVTTATSHEYTKGSMFRRNRYLVDNADLLLAAYEGQEGGTAMTVGYAQQTGIPVLFISPVKKTHLQ